MDSDALTVLIVEDEAFVRMIAADSLSDDGFAILEAGDAKEALALLETHGNVAVLFTDVKMPGELDGLQLAEIVAAARPDVKVLVTSGQEWISDARLPDQGVYLPKPYSPAKLTELVRRQARRR